MREGVDGRLEIMVLGSGASRATFRPMPKEIKMRLDREPPNAEAAAHRAAEQEQR